MPANALPIIDLGTLAYSEALAVQNRHFDEVRAAKERGRILVTQHPPTITVGRRGPGQNIIANNAKLAALAVNVVQTTRGGSVTFHGPGQVVIYPILNLRLLRLSVKDYVCALEKCMVQTCKTFGVEAQTSSAAMQPVGVWVGSAKIGQIGIHVSHGITRHGLAFNVEADLSYFDLINPCGLAGIRVTSLRAELQDHCPTFAVAQRALVSALQNALTK